MNLFSKFKKPTTGKARVGSVSKSTSKKKKIVVAVALLLAVGLGGNIGYTKWKAKDLQAKAGAHQLKYYHYPGGDFPANGVRFAACKKNSGTRPGYVDVIGVVGRPSLLDFSTRSKLASMVSERFVDPANTTQFSSNYDWFTLGNDALSFLKINGIRDTKDWVIRISYAGAKTITSKSVKMYEIAHC